MYAYTYSMCGLNYNIVVFITFISVNLSAKIKLTNLVELIYLQVPSGCFNTLYQLHLGPVIRSTK